MTELIGHDDAWAVWRAACASGRLHHAWLLAGPRGLGKGAFARAAAAALVAEPGVPQPALAMHPDILIPEHPPENKDEAKKREEGQPYTTKRAIPIDEIRRLQTRLTTRPTLGVRRAIIIDPADDLEKPAVNALLKSLEEPPTGTVFLLVAHRLGNLAPTLRSRCRVLRFAGLSEAELDAILTRAAPRADAAARAAAIAIAGGSPGVALGFLGEELGRVFTLMTRMAREGDPSLASRGALVSELGARPDRARLQAALALARAVLATELRTASRARAGRIIAAYPALVRLSAEAPSFNYEPGLLVLEIAGLLAGVGLARAA